MICWRNLHILYRKDLFQRNRSIRFSLEETDNNEIVHMYKSLRMQYWCSQGEKKLLKRNMGSQGKLEGNNL